MERDNIPTRFRRHHHAIIKEFSLRSRPKKERAGESVSPSRALVISCAHYFQAPATQPRPQGFSLKKWVGPFFEGKALGTRLLATPARKNKNASSKGVKVL